MATTFLVSDTHFGHAGVTKFMRRDGVTKLRPWDSVEEMDEELVRRWNDRVRPKDKVYHLGDVVINRKSLSIMDRLNGDKVLIKGNHDIFKLEDYSKYFRDVRSCHVLNGMILTHIPLHADSIGRFGTNIHGHLHEHRVMKSRMHFWKEIDPRFHCVCVEQTDYAPISLEEVQQRVIAEGGKVGMRSREEVYGSSAS
jgi:calcineurin-like phosphoesterase family protein